MNKDKTTTGCVRFAPYRSYVYKLSHTLVRIFKHFYVKQSLIYNNLRFLFSLCFSFFLFKQLVLPLFNFHNSNSDYYDGWQSTYKSAEELQWSPLGTIGNYPLSPSHYISYVRDNDVRHLCVSPPYCNSCASLCPPKHLKFTLAIWDMSQDLLISNLIEPSTAPVTCSYFALPKAGSTKCRGIRNLKHNNAQNAEIPTKYSPQF